VYDYSNHNRSDKVQHIEPAPVLIVEGILPFVEPSKRNADIIVPNGGENTTAIEMLAHHICSLIEKANMV
jgi:uridine kinase